VEPIVHLLLETLDTPSQSVQEAVAKCLPPLVACIKPQAADTIDTLLDKVIHYIFTATELSNTHKCGMYSFYCDFVHILILSV